MSTDERVGFGLLDKLYLVFNEPFWDDASTILLTGNGLPRGQFNYWVNLHKSFGVPAPVSLNGGDQAHELALLDDEELVATGLSALRSAYPEPLRNALARESRPGLADVDLKNLSGFSHQRLRWPF